MDQTKGKVPNPYVGIAGYNCFGCDPNNDNGLRLEFHRDGDIVTSTWDPRPELEGYPGVIHGGIQATLADEIGGWYLHAVHGSAGVTKQLSIQYLQPAKSEDAPFKLTARASEVGAKHATIEVTVAGASGTVFSTATCEFAVFSDAVARKRLHFPGREAFLPQND